MKAILVLAALAVITGLLGWWRYSNQDDSTTVTIDKQKIKQDAATAAEKARELGDEAREQAEELGETARERLDEARDEGEAKVEDALDDSQPPADNSP
jgi:uncharacterized protein HemX